MVNAYLRPSVGENVFFAEDVTRAEGEREERLTGTVRPTSLQVSEFWE